MGVNSLPKTVIRQRRDCDLNPRPSVPESSTLTTRLTSHPYVYYIVHYIGLLAPSVPRDLHMIKSGSEVWTRQQKAVLPTVGGAEPRVVVSVAVIRTTTTCSLLVRQY